MQIKLPIEVSARHAHLSAEDIQKLFGQGYQLKILKQLSQPSEFATQETVSIKSGLRTLEKIRVVGPARQNTQIEISKTDAVFLGVDAPIKISGDIAGSAQVEVIGPQGSINLSQGLIVAQRHIHCSIEESKNLGLNDNSKVSVRVEGDRPLIFENVAIRVKEEYKLSMHIDTDEGNACAINKIGQGTII